MMSDKHTQVINPVHYPVRLVQGGKEYFDLLLQLITAAKDTIHLQTYIYDDDETGELVATALKAAVKRGVKVYLLADGYASQVMSQHFIDGLRDAGIQFRFFEPVFRSRYFYFGRRLHHKIFIADACYSLVGGINITNRYNDLPDQPAWLDFAFYTEGETARELCILCWKTWNGFSAKAPHNFCEKQTNISASADPYLNGMIKMRRNDWVRNKKEISNTYISMFRHARSHITILCSYFLPGKLIRTLLGRAAARGVKIKVITAGPSDVMMAKHAERWLYDWLLRNKIELYEYQPSVLHAKIAVCDGEWFTIGSYNVNNISAYASIELNLDVHDPQLAAAAEQRIMHIAENECLPITPQVHLRSRNIFSQFIRWFSYQFIRGVFYILTFYYKQRG
jgi:cardiolipin synthase